MEVNLPEQLKMYILIMELSKLHPIFLKMYTTDGFS